MINELGIYTQSVISWLIFVLIFFSGYLLRWFFAGRKLKSAEGKARQLTDSAKKELFRPSQTLASEKACCLWPSFYLIALPPSDFLKALISFL